MILVGIDEAGRGPWAGPVVAAAVCLAGMSIPGLADSKTLSARRREALRDRLLSTPGIFWGIGEASPQEIDALNILRATHLAMLRALQGLRAQLSGHHESELEVWVDGNLSPARSLPSSDWPYATQTLIQGDRLRADISAASILAKTHRDQSMVALDAQHPGYGFAQHMGYGTAQHLSALERLGPCVVHRQSFAPVAALRRASA